jgi:NADH:ubiquinone oxidoreductase subunit 4 (subunit M)
MPVGTCQDLVGVFASVPFLTVALQNFRRMETLNLKRFHGIAKAAGVLFSTAGVTVLAFYQGPAFRSFIHHTAFSHHNVHAGVVTAAHPKSVWILGIFLTTLSTASWALWTVLQVKERVCPGGRSFIRLHGLDRSR